MLLLGGGGGSFSLGAPGLPGEDGVRVVYGSEWLRALGQLFPTSAGRVSGALGGAVC